MNREIIRARPSELNLPKDQRIDLRAVDEEAADARGKLLCRSSKHAVRDDAAPIATVQR